MTTDCNLSCSYCYQQFQDKKQCGTYSSETIDNIIKYIQYIYNNNNTIRPHIKLIGGEVTLYPETIETLIDLINNLDIQFGKFVLCTNGTFNESFIELLRRLDVTSNFTSTPNIGFSLDCNEIIHNKNRANEKFGKYEDIKNNIQYVMDKLGDKYNISVNSVVDFNDLESINELDIEPFNLNKKFGDIIYRNFSPLYKLDYTEKDVQLHFDLVNKIADQYIDILNKGHMNDYRTSFICSRCMDLMHLIDSLYIDSNRKQMCNIGDASVILPNGDISSCNMVIESKESIFHLGNVNNLMNINNGKKVEAIVLNNSPCGDCKNEFVCRCSCLFLSNGKLSCIPYRRIQSNQTIEAFRRVVSIPDFLYKYHRFVNWYKDHLKSSDYKDRTFIWSDIRKQIKNKLNITVDEYSGENIIGGEM